MGVSSSILKFSPPIYRGQATPLTAAVVFRKTVERGTAILHFAGYEVDREMYEGKSVPVG